MADRTALVLSGGGLRGGAHVGALKVFERVGLLPHVQVVAGASAGSIVGAMLASGTSVAGIEQAVQRLTKAPCDDLLDLNLIGLRQAMCSQDFSKLNGFLGGKAIIDLVEQNLTHVRRFSDYATLPPDLHDKTKDLLLVGANLNNGIKTVFCDATRYTSYDEGALCGSLSFSEAARASSSQPATLTPFVCPRGAGCTCGMSDGGQPCTFIDGALRESCPLKLVVRLAGCTRVLAINLGYAGDRVEDVGKLGIAEIVSQSITIMGTQHFDADVAFLRTQIAEGDLALSAHVLNPRLFDMSTFAFDRLPEAVERGEKAAAWFLDEADRQWQIFRPDGTVDPDRLFRQQGVNNFNYPDPEREARRAYLITVHEQKRPPTPCHVEKEITSLALLTVAAFVTISLALFTVGGVLALQIKPNAASLGDIFVFWDGGVIALIVGWIALFLLLRRAKCQSS